MAKSMLWNNQAVINLDNLLFARTAPPKIEGMKWYYPVILTMQNNTTMAINCDSPDEQTALLEKINETLT